MIILIIFLILFLVLLIPLGVHVIYDESGLKLCAVAGLIQICVFPRKKKEKKKGKDKKKNTAKSKTKKSKKQSSQSSTKKKGGKIELFRELIGIGVSALNCLRRKLVINQLYLSLTVGGLGTDAADAAILYGRAWAAIGSLIPFLEHTFKLKSRDLHADLDYTMEETTIFTDAKITISLIDILWIGIYNGIKALRVFLRYRKKVKGGKANGTRN